MEGIDKSDFIKATKNSLLISNLSFKKSYKNSVFLKVLCKQHKKQFILNRLIKIMLLIIELLLAMAYAHSKISAPKGLRYITDALSKENNSYYHDRTHGCFDAYLFYYVKWKIFLYMVANTNEVFNDDVLGNVIKDLIE